MGCPHLKEVVMLFCDAYAVKKMLPLDRIATADPCLGNYAQCPIFQELLARLDTVVDTTGSAPRERPTLRRKEAPR